MSDPRENISIRLEINIPVGATATGRQPEPEKRAPLPRFLDPNILFHDPPPPGSPTPPKTVRPRTGQSATGTICAKVVFAVDVDIVKAKVYPEVTTAPDDVPPDTAVQALPDPNDPSGRTFIWDDNQTYPANNSALRCVDHLLSDPYPLNTFAVWYQLKASGRWSPVALFQFAGKTGDSGFCGGSGSGSGGLFQSAPHVLPTTIYAVVTGGLVCDGTYALSYSRAAAAAGPTWIYAGPLGSCPAAHGSRNNLILTCHTSNNTWSLTTAGGTAHPATASYSPLQLVFTNQNLCSCGGSAHATITIVS